MQQTINKFDPAQNYPVPWEGDWLIFQTTINQYLIEQCRTLISTQIPRVRGVQMGSARLCLHKHEQ